MELFTALLLLLIGLLAFFVFRFQKIHKSARYPKGPKGIPILGNALQLRNKTHLKYSEWAYKFGELYSIRLGRKRAVVVSSPSAIREIFSSNAATGLFSPIVQRLVTNGEYGVLGTEGDVWDENRRFLVNAMKNFGCIQGKLEGLVLTEADCTLKWIKENSINRVISSDKVLKYTKLTTNSALWSVLTGKRLTEFGSELSTLHWEIVLAVQACVKKGILLLPWLKYVLPNWTGYNKMKDKAEESYIFFKKEFEQHKKTYVSGRVENIIDSYIEHVEGMRDPHSTFYGEEGYKNALGTINELFVAGSAALSSTLMWALIYLAAHVQTQEKLHEEIESFLGNEEPSVEHEKSMQYLEAIIWETLRFSSPVPFGVPLKLLNNLEYKGYSLPKDTTLIANLYHVHHNKSLWGDPHVFRPERFLGIDGEKLKTNVMPWQAGKRTCPGSFFAKDILFLFLAKIFQKFEVNVEGISKEDLLAPDEGYILLPKCHNLIFKPKQVSE